MASPSLTPKFAMGLGLLSGGLYLGVFLGALSSVLAVGAPPLLLVFLALCLGFGVVAALFNAPVAFLLLPMFGFQFKEDVALRDWKPDPVLWVFSLLALFAVGGVECLSLFHFFIEGETLAIPAFLLICCFVSACGAAGPALKTWRRGGDRLGGAVLAGIAGAIYPATYLDPLQGSAFALFSLAPLGGLVGALLALRWHRAVPGREPELLGEEGQGLGMLVLLVVFLGLVAWNPLSTPTLFYFWTVCNLGLPPLWGVVGRREGRLAQDRLAGAVLRRSLGWLPLLFMVHLILERGPQMVSLCQGHPPWRLSPWVVSGVALKMAEIVTTSCFFCYAGRLKPVPRALLILVVVALFLAPIPAWSPAWAGLRIICLRGRVLLLVALMRIARILGTDAPGDFQTKG